MPNLKIYGGIALVAAIVFGCIKLYKTGYNNGVNDEKIAQHEATEQARTKLIEDFNVKLTAATEAADKWKSKAIELQQRPEPKPTEVIKYVTEIKNTSSCDYLGPKFRSMFNDYARQLTSGNGSTK